MKKYILDLTVTENTKLHDSYVLLKLTHSEALPEMQPGQFAEIRVDNSPTTFLRRPISINYVDTEKNEVWFLVRLAGDGTRKLATVNVGDIVNVAISHGEGRFFASEELALELAKNGQIATQYVDMLDQPTADVRFNPNGSIFAIEGITSPDGRVFGKMGHSERIGKNLYKNVPGEFDMKMFKSAMKYFR